MSEQLHPQKTNNIVIRVLIILVIILIWLVWVSNRKRISYFVWQNQETTGSETWQTLGQWEYFFGKEVSLYWKILSNGDRTSYTHTLQQQDGTVFWLKSGTYSLDKFLWTGRVGWIVRDIKNDLYIIEVNTIVMDNQTTQETTENNVVPWIQYIKDGRLLIRDLSGSAISMFFDTEQNTVTLDKEGTKSLLIKYFPCQGWQCDQIQTAMEITSSIDYTTTDGHQFYKVPETASWFGSFDKTMWYYLETDDKLFLIEAMQYVQIIWQTRAQSFFWSASKELCFDTQDALYSVDNIVVETKNTTDTVKVTGRTSDSKEVTCTIELDPHKRLWGTLLSFVSEQPQNDDEIDIETWAVEQNITDTDNQITEETTEETTTSWANIVNRQPLGVTKDTSVDQFAITTEKTLDFYAREWYTIQFPSKSIRFTSENSKEDLWYDNLYCYAYVHVVAYANKDNLDVEPAVKLYICNDTDTYLEQMESSYIVHRDIENKRMYLIAIMDPARYDFATNIVIK